MFEFGQLKKVDNIRVGDFVTPHGTINTPVFMPVGTQASVKSLTSDDLRGLEAEVILGNTYHLHLRPGEQLVRQMGGLHEFMRWDRPILTDSGGFQVSSLGHFKKKGGEALSKVDEEGVTFYSHIDGSKKRLTPEKAVEIQEALGSDIIMAFDEAAPDLGKKYAQESMDRTHRWLVRSKKRWLELEAEKEVGRLPQTLFGIIQGGRFADLRKESAEFIVAQGLAGVALGGESIGQDAKETAETIEWVREVLPKNVPLYTMGVGVNPVQMVEVFMAGADMMDCVSPTRLARCGQIYSGKLATWTEGSSLKAAFESEFKNGTYLIDKKIWSTDKTTLGHDCGCYACKCGYTKAYLHHLFKAKELTYYRLATIHNVYSMVQTAKALRRAILG